MYRVRKGAYADVLAWWWGCPFPRIHYVPPCQTAPLRSARYGGCPLRSVSDKRHNNPRVQDFVHRYGKAALDRAEVSKTRKGAYADVLVLLWGCPFPRNIMSCPVKCPLRLPSLRSLGGS